MSELIPIEVSARHVHLSFHDIQALFGEGKKLAISAELSQPSQFVAKERVDLVGPKGLIEKVAIVGPERKETQVEISCTDAFRLGLKDVRVLQSGDLKNSIGGLKIVGLNREIDLKQGVIVAARHLHASPEQANSFDLHDGAFIKIKISGRRAVIFEQVLVRAKPGHELALHLDTDEANAAGVKTGDFGKIVI